MKFAKKIFVPGDDYFKNKFEGLKTSIMNKTNISVNELNSLNLEPVVPGDVFGTYNGQTMTFVNLSFVRDNIVYIRSAIGTLLYIFLFYFNYRSLMKLIRGFDFGGGK